MARCVALIFNWWNLFVRLADPENGDDVRVVKPRGGLGLPFQACVEGAPLTVVDVVGELGVLTVNEVDKTRFGVNVITHTQAVTTLGQVEVGQRVNLEVDMLARYVARLLEHGKS